MRTSETHPLEIALVSAGPDMGTVGLTFCPGKNQPSAMTGGWQRDLELDLKAIRDTGASAVVTLVEQHELSTLGVEQLGTEVRRQHMDWFHLPISDMGVPGEQFERSWQHVGEGIRTRIRNGFGVGWFTARVVSVAPARSRHAFWLSSEVRRMSQSGKFALSGPARSKTRRKNNTSRRVGRCP